MITTVKDIAALLTARAEEYARFLLPNGKKNGGEWEVGSVGGEPGKSLKVRVSGEKAGRWADFASNDKGDLIGLTCAVRNVKIGEAIRIAKEWLGIRDPESVIPKKSYQKPKPKNVIKADENSAVFTYLADVRKLDLFTQLDFKVAQSNDKTGKGNGIEVAYPSYDPDGELTGVKYIAIKRSDSGKKFMSQEAGCAPHLFGWQAIKDDAREVIITEGEIDCMTWHQIGFPALSVPNGANSETWIDLEWDNLQRFDQIWLNYDNDPVGQKAVKSIAKRLGYNRCLILTLPGYKDANEALCAGMEPAFFAQAVAAAKPITPEQIKSPVAFKDRVIDKFYPSELSKVGFFSDLFRGKLGMRKGEVTIWTGITSHGKSVILSQLMLEAIIQGNRVALGSFEMLGEQTLHRMLCQSESRNDVSRDNISAILDWLSGRLWIYDLLGNVSPKLVFELLEYSYSRHGVEMFVIDSLMKCSVASDDYNAQRIFLNDLCSFAKDTRTHINLVAHARKGADESDTPGKLDVKGSSDIINQADNILCVWRNKPKEEKKYDLDNSKDKPKSQNSYDPLDLEPDTIVYCTKQRETGDEFAERFRYLKGCFSFMNMKAGMRLDLSIIKEINAPKLQMEGTTEIQESIQEVNETEADNI